MLARLLLGLTFLVFGLNSFLHFIPQTPMPAGAAGDFSRVLFTTHYFDVVGAVMTVSGLLLLTNFFVPLALILLGPVLVNILIFHILMAPKSIGIAAIAALLWFVVFFRHLPAFSGLFKRSLD
jgi:putative oxidoreductase